MKCPNENCGDRIEEHVNSRGGGSRYCSACGYYEELPPGAMPKPKRQRVEPPTPLGPKKKPRR